jgi:hypothetical protein
VDVRFARDRYGAGLAAKCSGYAAEVGFVLSTAEMRRLGELRESMDRTAVAARHAGNVVAAGLGAVGAGLLAVALGRSLGPGRGR